MDLIIDLINTNKKIHRFYASPEFNREEIHSLLLTDPRYKTFNDERKAKYTERLRLSNELASQKLSEIKI